MSLEIIFQHPPWTQGSRTDFLGSVWAPCAAPHTLTEYHPCVRAQNSVGYRHLDKIQILFVAPHRGGSPGGTLQGLGEAGEARAAAVGQEERESMTKQGEVWFRKDKGTVTKGDTGTGRPQWHHWPPRANDISTMKTKASENLGASVALATCPVLSGPCAGQTWILNIWAGEGQVPRGWPQGTLRRLS